MLIIVHDLNRAARFADRILMLHDGNSVVLGRPAEVMRADLIEHPLYGCPLVVS